MIRLAAIATLVAWSTAAMAANPVSRTGSFHLDVPPARAFPLFTAEGERAWLGQEEAPPATTVTGSATQLFGLLLGRLEPAALTCGDTAQAARFKRAFPGP